MAKIVLHLKKGDLNRDLKGWHLQFYSALRTIAQESRITLEIRARDADIRVGTRAIHDNRFDDGNLHIIDDRSVVAPNVLNAGVAYFWRFWHLDPHGTKAFSSIGDLAYEPRQMPFERAKIFYDKMRQRYVEKRKSKYGQPVETQTVPKGAVSVFFQGTYPQSSGATTTSDHAMLNTVLAQVGDLPVVVKAHPKASTISDIERIESIAANDERLTITNANVHDILGSSIATVSINSTVALEGFLHRKPAILFGRSDFHHFTSAVGESLGFKEALEHELEREDGYEQYFAWYFLKNCLSLNSGKLSSQIWKKFDEVGLPKNNFLRQDEK